MLVSGSTGTHPQHCVHTSPSKFSSSRTYTVRNGRQHIHQHGLGKLDRSSLSEHRNQSCLALAGDWALGNNDNRHYYFIGSLLLFISLLVVNCNFVALTPMFEVFLPTVQRLRIISAPLHHDVLLIIK
jgi:hypothetical protein